MQNTKNVPELDRSMLENVLHRAGFLSANVVSWLINKLSGGYETISDVYRVEVHTQLHDGSTIDLCLLLKIIRATPDRRSPQHWNYWRREPEAYQTGALNALPAGISAPQCYEVIERDDEVWLWLQFMSETHVAQPSAEDIGRVAFELGRFNGSYLANTAVPQGSWISHDWLRHYVGSYAATIEQLPKLQTHPLIGHAFTPALLSRLLHLTAQREQLLDELDNLPQVFCHLDAWRNNLFLTGHPPHEKQLVLIDWAFTGIGAIGQELAPLLSSDKQLPNIHALTCQNYVAGLRSFGWQGPIATIMRSSAIALALTYSVAMTGLYINDLLDEREHAVLEATFGMPVEQILPYLRQWVELGLDYIDKVMS